LFGWSFFCPFKCGFFKRLFRIGNCSNDHLPAPVPVPVGAPVAPNLVPTIAPLGESCNPKKSFLYFTGHDEASSISRGRANITWSPAITYSAELQKFLWCGNFTYDVFVAQGGFDFLDANISGPNLIALANTTGTNMVRFETK
jgi:hypothetical protein